MISSQDPCPQLLNLALPVSGHAFDVVRVPSGPWLLGIFGDQDVDLHQAPGVLLALREDICDFALVVIVFVALLDLLESRFNKVNLAVDFMEGLPELPGALDRVVAFLGGVEELKDRADDADGVCHGRR